MSGSAAASQTSADRHSLDQPMSGWAFLYRSAERFGMPTILAAVLLWWARTDLVKPLLDAHYEFLGEIRKQGDDHSERLEELIQLIRSQNFMMRDGAEVGRKGTVPSQPSG